MQGERSRAGVRGDGGVGAAAADRRARHAEAGQIDPIRPRLEIGDRIGCTAPHRCQREYEHVLACAAGQGVSAASTIDIIVAVAAIDRVGAAGSEDGVVARLAENGAGLVAVQSDIEIARSAEVNLAIDRSVIDDGIGARRAAIAVDVQIDPAVDDAAGLVGERQAAAIERHAGLDRGGPHDMAAVDEMLDAVRAGEGYRYGRCTAFVGERADRAEIIDGRGMRLGPIAVSADVALARDRPAVRQRAAIEAVEADADERAGCSRDRAGIGEIQSPRLIAGRGRRIRCRGNCTGIHHRAIDAAFDIGADRTW